MLEQLRESPVAGDGELVTKIDVGVRRLARRLKAPKTATGPTKGVGKWTTIYYLYGDERRAVRTAIEANEDYIHSAFGADGRGHNPFADDWPEFLYDILCEEWDYHVRNAGGDGDV